MKSSRESKSIVVPSVPTPEQLVLNAYLTSTKDPAFRAFAKRMLVPKQKRKSTAAA